MERRTSKQVTIGNCIIGGNQPILVQSMTNTDTQDADATIAQIHGLEKAGCDIVRFAVPDMAAASAVEKIKGETKIPLVADIHFDYRLALACADAGIDKIRINPGNIGDEGRVRSVTQKCFQKKIPIRIGVNSGSLEKQFLEKHGRICPQAMVDSALYHISLLEKFDFDQIVVSLKSSDVGFTIQAYRLLAQQCAYPLHVGVTETGGVTLGKMKSAIGIGSLLADGIGDTIRVSLTAPPVEEVYAGYDILRALRLRQEGLELISCPTCGRCKVDVIDIVKEFEERSTGIKQTLKVAIMGCAVNGPGEARDADIGIAGGDGEFLLFKKGEVIRKIPQGHAVDELLQEIIQMK